MQWILAFLLVLYTIRGEECTLPDAGGGMLVASAEDMASCISSIPFNFTNPFLNHFDYLGVPTLSSRS